MDTLKPQQDSITHTHSVTREEETRVRRLAEEARKAEILAEKLEKRMNMVGPSTCSFNIVSRTRPVEF